MKQPITREAVLALIAKRKHMAQKRRNTALQTMSLINAGLAEQNFDIAREAIKAATENVVALELETLLDLVDKGFE